MAGTFTSAWRRRPTPPGGTASTRLIGFTLVAVGVAVFVFSNRPPGPPSLDTDAPGFVEAWNAAADEAGRPELAMSDGLQETPTDGVLGWPFTPDLRVLVRVGDDTDGRLTEAVAVGNPGRDGTTDVLAVFDLLLRVVEPDLEPSERREILGELGVEDGSVPATLRTSTRSDRFEYRATGDAGQIGIGVTPLLPA